MTDRFLQSYGEVRDALAALPPDVALREIVESYADGIHRMFAQLPQYYLFLVLKLLPGPERDRNRFYKLGDDISRIILPHLEADAAESAGNRTTATVAGRRKDSMQLMLMYTHVQLVVWSAFAFWTPLCRLRNHQQELSESQRMARVAHTVGLCLHGLFPRAVHDIDYRAVERVAAVRRDELLEPNRIFAAVEAVVTEVGFEMASLDRIAKRLGMTKSSLYFYFENKDTMFSRALQTERRHFNDLFASRCDRLGSFSQRLYGYIVTLASYFLSNRSLMVFSNWVQVQRVPVTAGTADEDEILQSAEFIRQRLEKHSDPVRRDETLETLALLSILMNRGLTTTGLSLERPRELFAYTRDFYRTVTHGIAPAGKDVYP